LAKWYRLAALLIVGLFIAACATPFFDRCPPGLQRRWEYGFAPLLFGWIGIPHGIYAWCGNIPLAACLVYLVQGRATPLWLPVVGGLVALTGLGPMWIGGRICGRDVGFWLWLGAFAVAVLASLAAVAIGLRSRRSKSMTG
jgi:hypothetical protein